MNKTDIIYRLAEKLEITQIFAKDCVEGVFEVIQEELAEKAKSGQKAKVTISNFGTFGLSRRKAFSGTNPVTGAGMNVGSRISPKFKAGKGLKKALND
jgi:DNA-binding protein HU-beta